MTILGLEGLQNNSNNNINTEDLLLQIVSDNSETVMHELFNKCQFELDVLDELYGIQRARRISGSKAAIEAFYGQQITEFSVEGKILEFLDGALSYIVRLIRSICTFVKNKIMAIIHYITSLFSKRDEKIYEDIEIVWEDPALQKKTRRHIFYLRTKGTRI